MRSTALGIRIRRRGLALWACAAALTLAAPGSAIAGSAGVTSNGTVLSFSAGGGEANQVFASRTVSDSVTSWAIQDLGATVLALPGCTNLTLNAVTCTLVGESPVGQFFLGERDDKLVLTSETPKRSCSPVLVYGGFGSDRLSAGQARCKQRGVNLYGDDQADVLRGSTGADELIGGTGDDALAGARGKDFILGQAGDDLLSGGRGSDSLLGQSGGDLLKGGRGRDVLRGGTSVDRLQAADHRPDLKINCGRGSPDRATFDRREEPVVKACERRQ